MNFILSVRVLIGFRNVVCYKCYILYPLKQQPSDLKMTRSVSWASISNFVGWFPLPRWPMFISISLFSINLSTQNLKRLALLVTQHRYHSLNKSSCASEWCKVWLTHQQHGANQCKCRRARWGWTKRVLGGQHLWAGPKRSQQSSYITFFSDTNWLVQGGTSYRAMGREKDHVRAGPPWWVGGRII